MSNSPFRKQVLAKDSPEARDPRWQRWEMRDFAAPRRPLRARNEANTAEDANAAAQALAEQQPLLDSWRTLSGEFQRSLNSLDGVIAARLMQLALTAAKQIIGQTPLCDASGVLQQIQQLIQQEPLFSGNLQLRVNPQDLPLVQQHLGVQLEQQGWKLLADTQLHRGGCKISAEGGELDASIATRWQELCKLAAPELPL